eukprot:CAMPEP_0172719882 /NCGR_PEP_ID=MMETSP1074-20121228/75756_1 /TAXON_ID=2916 /ORGANISM="Ceratium fusus, Strain PA161109" /LENGTH=703 /DNA_ID=CAMNT_0013545281 /DNA_START=62 /DNA_END=2173 /DNA_ORIENTATION=-
MAPRTAFHLRAFSALTVLLVASSFQLATTSALLVASTTDKIRPVSKVVVLLKDMLKELEKEAEKDEEIYDKMSCWCETNDKEKTKTISDAGSKIDDLTTQIAELSARSGKLASEVKNLRKEAAAGQAALDKATALREKQLAEFNAEEKDSLQSITALKAAIIVLHKHNGKSTKKKGKSFLQQKHVRRVVRSLRAVMQRHGRLVESMVLPSHLKTVLSFIQVGADDLDAESTEESQPASGEIYGVITQMKETFEKNLKESQQEEKNNLKAYKDLKAAKEAEVKASKALANKKFQERADGDEKRASAMEDLDDTKKSMAADQKFLAMLKEKCKMTDTEWTKRTKMRQAEMEAVSKAMTVLSDEAAHDLFTRTFNPGLLQKESREHSSRRAQAAAFLSKEALKLHSSQLSALAYSVRLDAFTKVKKAIDNMIAQLLKEQANEVKHKDFCVEEFSSNKLQTQDKSREKASLVAKATDLAQTADDLSDAIDKLKAESAEMKIQLKRAGEDREKENAEFRVQVADQRETVKLLNAALEILSDFYSKAAAALLEKRDDADGSPPPPGFSAYKKNAKGGGILNLIKQIITDAKAMEAEALRSEKSAQRAYEDFVKTTNANMDAKGKEMVNKKGNQAKIKATIVENRKALEEAAVELTKLSNHKANLHQSCDFVLKNFAVRQKARNDEVTALRQAKGVLSGAKFSEFLQRAL